MSRLLRVAILGLMTGLIFPCSLEFDPVAIPRYYRANGWALPGTTDFVPFASPRRLGEYPSANISGARAVILAHNDDPYIVKFPAQVFTLDGNAKRLRPVLAKAAILRWEANGKVFAYSYGLVPVSAHKIGGRWKIDTEVGCTFDATFIDETGDGVFRLLVPSSLTETLVPKWVQGTVPN
jgi:hypothetical protein